MQHDKILVLDFGSQYNQLIARRVRECNVYCELVPYNISSEEILKISPKGIILSGGPNSVNDTDAPTPDKKIFELGIPVLGICYGMQIMTKFLGGEVHSSSKQEFGHAEIMSCKQLNLFDNVFDKKWNVWMSHGDKVTVIPPGFEIYGKSENTVNAIIGNSQKNLFAVQFHPEVSHTENGVLFLDNFVKNICQCKGDWTPSAFIDESVSKIREIVGNKKIILGFSGGVDSAVAALLIDKAIGQNLICIFIDNGLLRHNERKYVETQFKEKIGLNLITLDREKEFLTALAGITDPEAKRKIIGKEFIVSFEEAVNNLKKEYGDIEFLAQGTIYPDVIESVSVKGGPSKTIKSHHNVGGLPDKMQLKILEPLRELFKDEVRRVGIELGLASEMVFRHPFPGPGLGVRVLEEVTKEKCNILRQADAIYLEEINNAGIYDQIAQAFAVFLPIRAVGVMGDYRTYENVIALRAVQTSDFMTANWYEFDHKLLARISTRIINEVSGINRVVYDISSKPPGTIEWE